MPEDYMAKGEPQRSCVCALPMTSEALDSTAGALCGSSAQKVGQRSLREPSHTRTVCLAKMSNIVFSKSHAGRRPYDETSTFRQRHALALVQNMGRQLVLNAKLAARGVSEEVNTQTSVLAARQTTQWTGSGGEAVVQMQRKHIRRELEGGGGGVVVVELAAENPGQRRRCGDMDSLPCMNCTTQPCPCRRRRKRGKLSKCARLNDAALHHDERSDVTKGFHHCFTSGHWTSTSSHETGKDFRRPTGEHPIEIIMPLIIAMSSSVFSLLQRELFHYTSHVEILRTSGSNVLISFLVTRYTNAYCLAGRHIHLIPQPTRYQLDPRGLHANEKRTRKPPTMISKLLANKKSGLAEKEVSAARTARALTALERRGNHLAWNKFWKGNSEDHGTTHEHHGQSTRSIPLQRECAGYSQPAYLRFALQFLSHPKTTMHWRFFCLQNRTNTNELVYGGLTTDPGGISDSPRCCVWHTRTLHSVCKPVDMKTMPCAEVAACVDLLRANEFSQHGVHAAGCELYTQPGASCTRSRVYAVHAWGIGHCSQLPSDSDCSVQRTFNGDVAQYAARKQMRTGDFMKAMAYIIISHRKHFHFRTIADTVMLLCTRCNKCCNGPENLDRIIPNMLMNIRVSVFILTSSEEVLVGNALPALPAMPSSTCSDFGEEVVEREIGFRQECGLKLQVLQAGWLRVKQLTHQQSPRITQSLEVGLDSACAERAVVVFDQHVNIASLRAASSRLPITTALRWRDSRSSVSLGPARNVSSAQPSSEERKRLRLVRLTDTRSGTSASPRNGKCHQDKNKGAPEEKHKMEHMGPCNENIDEDDAILSIRLPTASLGIIRRSCCMESTEHQCRAIVELASGVESMMIRPKTHLRDRTDVQYSGDSNDANRLAGTGLVECSSTYGRQN
ncbi:uncharacterized protein MYCFIDRAFT_180683 [Pseudocercospora fijiensis CIRAD86]|uniref:Uncharacterized protein n=1 Tax=Pseudocercospora fijiensis (strain CIRAD86) TaxID=383855 RepID=M2ZXH6_PSEFD|nr:uncharacterized protein MYCFIDRAFT_180683 [Pseudocercospora fijiensis CIRAD86]EME76781.1 hypothetical protein MYCFIDRAFT_180683 [Pseudocercospora fijiensis CIRAD86]